jgi:hypothetical protein
MRLLHSTYHLYAKATASKMLSKCPTYEKMKQDVIALTSLISNSIWRRELVESLKYNVTCLDGGRNRVRRKGHEESSARVLNLLEKCDCAVVFPYGAQYRHELAIKTEFIKEHWF